jgi:hypothetical protein
MYSGVFEATCTRFFPPFDQASKIHHLPQVCSLVPIFTNAVENGRSQISYFEKSRIDPICITAHANL